MSKLKKGLMILVLYLFILQYLTSQNFLQDNEYYKKGVELLDQARQENEKGNYDKANEYAIQADEYFDKAGAFNLVMVTLLRANTKKEIARQTLERGKTFGVDSNEKTADIYQSAKEAYDEGEQKLTEGNEKTEFSEKIVTYQEAVDLFVSANEKATAALSEISDALKSAMNKLKEARDKHSALINNEVIKENDETDQIINQLIADSEDAFKNNEYVISYNKANDAVEFMDQLAQKDEAAKSLKTAQDELQNAKSKGAEKLYQNEVNEAEKLINQSAKLYSDENYSESLVNSKDALGILRNFDYQKLMALADQDQQNVFPKYYKIRLIPNMRDCLWRIAKYDFVYNNPWYWTVLYKANKDKLKFPDNPNLIYPTVILEIPSIKGEKREGEYDPAKKYPKFNLK